MLSKKKIMPILIVILLLIVGIAAFKVKKPNPIAAASSSKVSVKVYQVDSVEKNPIITYKASLDASEEGTVSSKVSGKVVQIMFENSQFVSQGDPLVQLDDQDIRNNIASSESKLAASQISLEKIQLNIENAQRSYDRTKALFDHGAASQVDLENAQTTLKNAQTDLESTKANINSAQIDLNNLKSTLANTTITAPISGVMDEKTVDLGQYVNTGAVLGKVKQIAPIDAVIEVNQNDIGSLAIGQSVKVKVGDSQVKEYQGTIKRIDPSADPASRVIKCKIEVDNKDQSLKPGIYATVEIESTQKSETIALPTQALTGNEGNYSVLVDEKGVARKHTVTIGLITNGNVEIKSGLSKGDNVIMTNVNTLQDGDEVTVVKE